MPLLGAVTGGGFDLSHSAVGGSPPSGLIPTENALRLESVSIGADGHNRISVAQSLQGLAEFASHKFGNPPKSSLVSALSACFS